MQNIIVGTKGVGKTEAIYNKIRKALADGKKVFIYNEAVKYYNKRFGLPMHDELGTAIFVSGNIINPPPLIEFRSITD